LHLRERVETEINSVTDNPIVLSDHRVVSGGNFHGQPLAMTLDYAGIAASEIGNISERRIYLSLLGNSEGVPKLLMYDLGLNSGFMILQYTAAALVSENKSLCYPASADSIPTSLGQEDHVSMGSISGRKTLSIIDNLEKVLGIELMAACQALEFRFPLRPYPLLEIIHGTIRKEVPFLKSDELFYPYLNKVVRMVKEFYILNLIKNYNNEHDGGIGTAYEELFEIY
jgi:histidine ammonia-lyase